MSADDAQPDSARQTSQPDGMTKTMSALAIGLIVVGRALRKQLSTAIGNDDWREAFRLQMRDVIARETLFTGFSIDEEPALYEAAFAAVEMILADDSQRPVVADDDR